MALLDPNRSLWMVIADLITERDNPWVDVFDATRVGGTQAAKRFVKENVSVGCTS